MSDLRCGTCNIENCGKSGAGRAQSIVPLAMGTLGNGKHAARSVLGIQHLVAERTGIEWKQRVVWTGFHGIRL